MGSRRNPRGTRLGTHKDKTRTRMEQRAKDKRVQTALEKAREEQARLDARMALEKAQEKVDKLTAPIPITSTKAVPTHETIRRAELDLAAERVKEQKRAIWSLADARDLIRAGYTLEHTMARTGWPKKMLEDAKPWECDS